jgi:hypothetical protein
MNSYHNLNRPGTRTSTTIDPKNVAEDVNYRIMTLDPNATPLIWIGDKIGTGKAPVNHKIVVQQYHSFDNFDYCSATIMGGGAEARFARLTMDQVSRPDVSTFMYYYPQDKLYIVSTGQTVEVVMNPYDSIPYGTGTTKWAFDAGSTLIAGGSTTRSAAGTIIVRNIEPYPLKPFSTSDVIYLGRSIYESQKIEATSKQRDYVYDCNFVEHKEEVLIMTEDQKKWLKTKNGIPDWTFQQKEMMKEFKMGVEFNAMFSEREVDYSIVDRPKRHMRGLMNAIRTNVAYYNPATIVDFESMYSNFLYEQAFRYNPNGYKKLAICGGRFLYDFNIAFREYRQTVGISPGQVGKETGLDISSYVLPGGHRVELTRSEVLRMNTPLEHWCFVVDPSLMEWRIVKNFATRYYQNNDERDEKVMVEWQGSIAWHLEQAHSLLRTA